MVDYTIYDIDDIFWGRIQTMRKVLRVSINRVE
jgi:hypothetical protein